MSRRLEVHEMLCSILGCPTSGDDCHCYFQPPPSVKMSYPAIVYSLDDIYSEYSNNGVYLSHPRFTVTLITKDPDSSMIESIAQFPTCRFDRHYKSDNLNHYTYLLY